MDRPLRILFVEDSEEDAELIERELRKAGIGFESVRVDTKPALVQALQEFSPDLILSDYALPSFDGTAALELAQQLSPQTPFIFVSGTIGEERAIESLKRGATDYVIKDRPARLGPALRRALQDAEDRRKRLQAEEALRKSEAFQSLVLRSLPMTFYRAQPGTRRLTWITEQVDRVTGFRAERFVREPSFWESRIHPDDRNRVVESFASLPGKDAISVEYRWRCADGVYRWFFDHAVLVQALDEASGQIVGSWLDVTERKGLEEQLRVAQRMEAIGRLASGVAHDFNNLLTVILWNAEIARERLGEDSPLRQYVQEVHRAGERASSLTQQLLAFSRKQVLEPKIVSLNNVVHEMDRMLRRLIGEDVELNIRLDPQVGRVRADPSQIEQVIMNLAVNARDAMPGGGHLAIETTNVELDEGYAARHVAVTPGPYVRLLMSDSGHGMDLQTQARIFEPFFTTKERGRGTGLGLSTVYGIVKQSGGNIWVYSEPGHGATFKIYLPRIEDAAESLTRPQPRIESFQGTETVLLVEDEDMLRSLAYRVLKSSGYTVLEARDGRDALALARSHPSAIHVLLTDVVMPGMSGRELAEQLRSERPEIPVLFMSGYTDETIAQHGMLEPGVVLLQKPFTASSLLRKLREVLDTSHPGNAS
jgi:two-component system, cell cycle sensor histidine kinase and response regulator CckA